MDLEDFYKQKRQLARQQADVELDALRAQADKALAERDKFAPGTEQFNKAEAQFQAVMSALIQRREQLKQEMAQIEAEEQADALAKYKQGLADRLAALNDFLGQQNAAQGLADSEYQRRLEETKAQLESGMIGQREAQRRNNDAARQYRAELEKILQVLLLIQQTEPEMQGLGAAINHTRADIERLKNQEQDDTFFGRMHRNLKALGDDWSAFGRNVADALTTGIGSAVRGVTDSIMGAIEGTNKWGQVFGQVAKGIIASLIQVVIQWVLSKTIIAALDKVFGQKKQEEQVNAAAMWGPGAVAASIATYGAAAGVGLAAYLAALAVGTAAGAGMSILGRESGGPVDAGTPYIVGERGPELFVPRIGGGIVNAMQTLALSKPRVLAPMSAPGGPAWSAAGALRGGGSGAAGPVVNAPEPKVEVRVLMFDDFSKLKQEIEKGALDGAIVKIVSRHKTTIGISS